MSAVSEEKQRSQIFHFNSSEVKQRIVSVVNEEKQRGECSQ